MLDTWGEGTVFWFVQLHGGSMNFRNSAGEVKLRVQGYMEYELPLRHPNGHVQYAIRQIGLEPRTEV